MTDLCTLEYVRLFAFVNNRFEVFFEDAVPAPYDYAGPPGLLRYEEIAPINAQRFRAEFTQHIPPGLSGPRVIEIDGLPNGNCADVNDDLHHDPY